MSSCSAILLAAGRSQRLGFDKILTPLCGQPVLLYSLKSLLSSDLIGEIILVTRKDIIPAIEELVRAENPSKPWKVIEGGAERQFSVFEGLQSVGREFDQVLIHDAARPLLTAATIEKTVSAARIHGGAVAAHRATDTLKEVSDGGEIKTTIDRSRVWLMETPQVFEKKIITESYESVIRKKILVTDDASTVEFAGGRVVVVESDTLNLKITRSTDWQILELWLSRAEGKGIRGEFHQLNNELSPLVGYLPLLAKYGGTDLKFLEYMEKCQSSVLAVQRQLQILRNRLRQLFPDE